MIRGAMKRIAIVALIVLAGCGKNSGPSPDQKGKMLFQFEGKRSVVDSVEYGLSKEMSDPAVMGRKDEDGTRHALVMKARMVTKTFSADGRDVTADVAFDMGDAKGSLQVGDK